MLDAMTHRGPDDRGLHVCENGVFGHTRLSIVDVARGHQPIMEADGRVGIICNGEVYNYRKLREGLESRYRFQTDSDTESVLRLYQETGPAAVSRLDGMFSLAIFDGDDFLLARDPVGIKPLYYGYVDDHMYFASELGAMSLAEVETVYEFPAGHYYTPASGFVQYYHLPEAEEQSLADPDEACRRLREIFVQAVHKRLLADKQVHVGSFCSGGLDSSLVAAIAAEQIPNLHTFAVGMRDESGRVSDDLRAGRIVADHIRSTHHELVFTEDDYYQVLPTVIQKLESYDPSLVRCAVPCFFTCKLAAEHVTVVLTGEGADESFAGYQYMKRLPPDQLNSEVRRNLLGLHNINLQRADRIGMYFSLELRVPFLDTGVIDLALKMPPDLKIREVNGVPVEKWILRQAFSGSGYLPDEILWRKKVQYTQGAGCENLGEILAEREISDQELVRIKLEHPRAHIESKEAAYYFKIFRQSHPQDSILSSIGIWKGFEFAEERESVRGTV